LHLSIGEKDLPGASFTIAELTERIHAVIESLKLKSRVKGVLINCLTAVGGNEEMISLLQTLKEWGITVILWVGETTRYPWFDPSQYIVAFVTHQHWPNFRVNEVRYIMGEKDWLEPDIYDVNMNATCYVVPTPNAKGAAVVAFITECKRPWGVLGKSAAIDFKLKE